MRKLVHEDPIIPLLIDRDQELQAYFQSQDKLLQDYPPGYHDQPSAPPADWTTQTTPYVYAPVSPYPGNFPGYGQYPTMPTQPTSYHPGSNQPMYPGYTPNPGYSQPPYYPPQPYAYAGQTQYQPLQPQQYPLHGITRPTASYDPNSMPQLPSGFGLSTNGGANAYWQPDPNRSTTQYHPGYPETHVETSGYFHQQHEIVPSTSSPATGKYTGDSSGTNKSRIVNFDWDEALFGYEPYGTTFSTVPSPYEGKSQVNETITSSETPQGYVTDNYMQQFKNLNIGWNI